MLLQMAPHKNEILVHVNRPVLTLRRDDESKSKRPCAKKKKKKRFTCLIVSTSCVIYYIDSIHYTLVLHTPAFFIN